MNQGARIRLASSLLWAVVCGGAVAVASLFPEDWPLWLPLPLVMMGAIVGGAVGRFPGVAALVRRLMRSRPDAIDEARDEGPAALLDPRRQVVEFAGRRGELAGLIAWCEDEAAGPVRLVTGPGGVGKTRLSVELSSRMTGRGWRCVAVGEGAEGTVISALRAAHAGPLLLVVDHAETRLRTGDLFREVAAAAGTVRVLLLARGAGQWWDLLVTGDAGSRIRLADAYAGTSLPVTLGEGATDTELVNAAVPRFAAELGVEPPGHVIVVSGPEPGRILDVHAAALVAVLRTRAARDRGEEPGTVRVRVEEVLGRLLGHEEKFWEASARRAGLLEGPGRLTPVALRRVVAAGCLLGAVSESEAVEVLGWVPGVAASADVARWLRDLYPPDPAVSGGGEREWWGPLRPDRLAEHHTVAELEASPELARACLQELTDRQALRAVTLLGRASGDGVTAGTLEPVLPWVERIVADLPADLALLSAMFAGIPYPSLALAETHVALNRRILDALPPGRSAERAHWLSVLGITLNQVGRPAEALPVSHEAVELWRDLAAAEPDRHRPALATALSVLSVGFVRQGRLAEALPVSREAVEIRREFAAADPDRHRLTLAGAVSLLGAALSALGRYAEALPLEQEAVEIWREVAAADPDRYRAGLATALSVLAPGYAELGRWAEALSIEQEALELWRELATAFPDRYRSAVANSLSNLGVRLAALDRLAEAVSAEQEAVGIRRELAATYPDRYRAALADSLSNLGGRISRLGRLDEGLPVTREAVEIRRELAAADPERYRPDLAISLTNLGATFSELGRRAEALAVEQEGLRIWRELAAAYPDRYRSDLARALSNLGVTFSGLGRPAEALPVTREAVEIRRELAAAYPDRHRPDLTDSLRNLADVLDAVNRATEATASRREAEELG